MNYERWGVFEGGWLTADGGRTDDYRTALRFASHGAAAAAAAAYGCGYPANMGWGA